MFLFLFEYPCFFPSGTILVVVVRGNFCAGVGFVENFQRPFRLNNGKICSRLHPPHTQTHARGRVRTQTRPHSHPSLSWLVVKPQYGADLQEIADLICSSLQQQETPSRHCPLALCKFPESVSWTCLSVRWNFLLRWIAKSPSAFFSTRFLL